MSKPLLFVVLGLLSLNAHSEQLSSIPMHELKRLGHARKLHHLNPNSQISFSIWLKIRNREKLTQLVNDIYNPHSHRYHQFLSQSEYIDEFAPLPETEEHLKNHFTQLGMRAKIRNHMLYLKGTVAQIEQAFKVKMNTYEYQNQKVFANTSEVRLNPAIAKDIAAIVGLNNLPIYQNNEESIKDKFMPSANPTAVSLNGFTGANLQKTYNLQNTPLVNGKRLDGSGQTLVVVDKCGSNTPEQILEDANQYFTANRINPFVIDGPNRNFAIINPDGTHFTNCPGAPAFSNEIDLDIEASHTIAPGNNTVLVLGENQKSILADVIQTLINQNFTIAGFTNAYVISNSWSGIEEDDQALEDVLALAAANGISVNFSAGDCGDNTYTTQKCSDPRTSPITNYPSSSSYVTAIGATALFVDNNYRYAFETVWGTVRNNNGNYLFAGGSGGGISTIYSQVQGQESLNGFYAGGYGQLSSDHKRAVPDIAMLGDPGTGLLIIADGQQIQDGGTSLACPLFAATLNLVNEARALLNKATPIGQAAPYLYTFNQTLLEKRALRLIIPPARMIAGATPPPSPITFANTIINPNPPVSAPASAFLLSNVIFGWDSALTVEPENQFWNDAVGVGSPFLPNFVIAMANI